MSQAFYRKYRSKKLSEVVGQKHITSVLEASLKKQKISHAYLFTGPRGVGKTSVARILAHEINNLDYTQEDFHPDIIEIDAASNNSVEDIRSLREQVQVAPISAAKRVYIIDEVHMLSKQAFNALLKTLEEPPAHVVFILATTDTHKIPATIISRTQQFVFRYISEADVIGHLKTIAKAEKISITDEALAIIAERGGGSFRDSISLLDQVSGLKADEITAEFLEQILGLTPHSISSDLINAYLQQNTSNIISIIDKVKKSGANLQGFIEQLLTQIKKLLPENPELSHIIMPIVEAKNSQFADLILLATLIKSPKSNNITHTPKPKVMSATASALVEEVQLKPKPIAQKVKKIIKEAPQKEAEIIPENTGEVKPFEWSNFLAQMKIENMPAYSILNSVEHEFEGETLKLYTGRTLYKKKLDTAKYRGLIGKVLAVLEAGGWRIETFAEQKTPEDEVAAAVFDIMGGGEEVKLNE